MPRSESHPDRPVGSPDDSPVDPTLRSFDGDGAGEGDRDPATAAEQNHPETTGAGSDPDRFTSAFLRLMSRAPGPVFPRARRLYFDKYPLESPQERTPFRTFLLEEAIEEGSDGSLRIEARALALVPWDPQRKEAAALEPAATGQVERYLREHWQRTTTEITTVDGPWFRTDSAYLRVSISAIYRSGGGRTGSLSRAGS